jgi:nucleoside-diphosphate-sugar epimerase
MKKHVLVIGSTGAMGQYLVPYLADMGYRVTALSLDEEIPYGENVACIRGDAMDREFLLPLLARGFDGIVNFMNYTRKYPFDAYMEPLLSATEHYIFLSSCRVYANEEVPVRESSPRLLDVSDDEALLASNDYCILKAKAEDLLAASSFGNWTVVRPSTVLSRRSFKLVTLEANNTVGRARRGKKVVLPVQAKEKPATLSWAGDVSRMIARLMFREEALRDVFNVCSAEHRTWGEIAGYYHELTGLEPVWVDKEDYLQILDPQLRPRFRWQLIYARLFDRITDNGKVLRLTGLKQEEMKPMFTAIREMIEALPEGFSFPEDEIGERMDAYLRERGLDS